MHEQLQQHESQETGYEREIALDGVAQQLISYSLEIKPGDRLLIKFDSTAREIVPLVHKHAEAAGAKVIIQYADAELEKTMLESVSANQFEYSKDELAEDHALQLQESVLGVLEGTGKRGLNEQTAYLASGPLQDEIRMLEQADKVLVLASRRTLKGFAIDATLEPEHTSMQRVLINERVNNKRWCLFRPPSAEEATAAKMSFQDYEKMCLEACNRDWEKVEQAQAVLIEKLSAAKKVTVIVPPPPGFAERWSTRFELEVTGKVAANSVAKRNMPGSEVFLSPNINEVEGKRVGTLTGTYALPYPVMLKDRVVPNLILHIEQGKVVSHEVDGTPEDYEHVQKLLDTDEGARWIGEFAMGTNPKIDRPVLNTLFVEKILGVHLALGNSYNYTDYMGQKVNVDNFNRSAIHVDISRVMTPAYGGGQILFDDELVFSDGKYLDDRLAVLNS